MQQNDIILSAKLDSKSNYPLYCLFNLFRAESHMRLSVLFSSQPRLPIISKTDYVYKKEKINTLMTDWIF